MAEQVGVGFTTSIAGSAPRQGLPFVDYHLFGGGGLNSEGATNHDGFAFTNVGPGPGSIVLKKVGYADQTVPVVFPIAANQDFPMVANALPVTNPNLNEALVIRGSYPGGYSPSQPNNALFVDEIDNMSGADQDRILDDYQSRGYTSITVGPIVAKGYHGLYPDTDWRGRLEEYLHFLTKLRERGLRICLVALPDIPPYLNPVGDNEGAWDLPSIQADLEPFLADRRLQALVEEVQLAWEPAAKNAEFVKVTGWLTKVFPNHRKWIHLTPGHGAPGMSYELTDTFTEASMWHTVRDAGDAKLGFASQGNQREFADDQRNKDGRLPLEQFAYDVMDALRHCAGTYGGWPILQYWVREFAAYFLFHDTPRYFTEDELRVWGDEAVKQGATHVGDGRHN